MIREQLNEIYEILFAHFGPQHWWPGDSEIEIITGAILTQNTNWGNVEKAIANLKAADCLSCDGLHSLEIDELAGLIRPAGYYNIKAKRLKNFIGWLFDDYDGQLENVESLSTDRLREELLSIKGIGPETADSILLYAFGREVFVIDTYTARVAFRHQLIETDAGYEQLQELFGSNLVGDVEMFNEYHALLVQVGKQFCKPKAKCEACPLKELPHTLDLEYY